MKVLGLYFLMCVVLTGFWTLYKAHYHRTKKGEESNE